MSFKIKFAPRSAPDPVVITCKSFEVKEGCLSAELTDGSKEVFILVNYYYYRVETATG